MSTLFTRGMRKLFLGSQGPLIFSPVNPTTQIEFPALKKIDLYIHIPFCKSACPYCPYNKIHYDKTLTQPYLNALLAEIDHYHNIFGRLEIPSIYIGGGTPTTLLDELGLVIQKIHDKFLVTGDICIETSPTDLLGREQSIQKLASYGISRISLGVQSFNDKHLQLIGRGYKSSILYPIIERLLAYNFKTVNLDLMFAMPNQTIDEAMEDLQTAFNAGVNQITLHSMFSLPYSTAGKYLKMANINAPSFSIRRKMYKEIHNFCIKNGFERDTVWIFKRGDGPRYSSVARENYLGIGAGAVSHLPGMFFLNTFVAKVYIAANLNHQSAIALKMNFSDEMTQYCWLYWQFYNTFIPKKELRERFGTHNKKIIILFKILKTTGLCRETDTNYELTESGAFWFCLTQKKLVIDPMNNVWSTAMKDPWPQEIRL